MSSLQRIFHVHTKKRFSHLPVGCFWAAAMGITESTATRHSDELPRQSDFSPARGAALLGPQILTSRPADPVGGWLLRGPTSPALASSDPRFPSPGAGVPAPQREPDCGGLSVC